MSRILENRQQTGLMEQMHMGKQKKNDATPLISVIMSVYNEEMFLREAVESIQNQTLQDWELIIVDDCSTDGTRDILKELQEKDPRIRVVLNEENLGLTVNLNRALEIAEGRFIARMDGDDISHPDRLEKELSYLQKHPDLMLISCRTETFGKEHLRSDIEGEPEYLRCRMLVRPVLAHPGFFVRGEVFRELGFRYDESFRQAQDYDLAARLTRKYSIGICPEVLLGYRAHEGQVSSKSGRNQFANADRVRTYLLQELGISLSAEEWEDFHCLIREERTVDLDVFLRVMQILDQIVQQNGKVQIYDPAVLKSTLGRIMADWIIRTKSREIYRQAGTIFHGDREYLGAYRREWIRILGRKFQRER